MSTNKIKSLYGENITKWYQKFHYHFILLCVISVQFNPGNANYVNDDLGSIASHLYLLTCTIFILLILNALFRMNKVFNIKQFSHKHLFMLIGFLLFVLVFIVMNFNIALNLVNRFY